jgi:hypothetical protein
LIEIFCSVCSSAFSEEGKKPNGEKMTEELHARKHLNCIILISISSLHNYRPFFCVVALETGRKKKKSEVENLSK